MFCSGIRMRRGVTVWILLAAGCLFIFFKCLPHGTIDKSMLEKLRPVQVDTQGEPIVEIAPPAVPVDGQLANVDANANFPDVPAAAPAVAPAVAPVAAPEAVAGAPVAPVAPAASAIPAVPEDVGDDQMDEALYTKGVTLDDIKKYLAENAENNDPAVESASSASSASSAGKKPAAGSLDGSRTAVEQLLDNLHRDHANLQNEVMGLKHKQQGGGLDGPDLDEVDAVAAAGGDGAVLSQSQVIEAQHLLEQLSNMYKNVKGAAHDLHEFLGKVGASGTSKACKHAAALLAAAKAADEDEDIRKINLAHVTKKRSLKRSVWDFEGFRRWLKDGDRTGRTEKQKAEEEWDALYNFI